MLNINEIYESWKIANNPSEEQSDLARKRLEICVSCEFKKEIFEKKNWLSWCGKCGCPLSKKIFTPQFKSCPLNKWNDVEEEYKSILKDVPKHLI